MDDKVIYATNASQIIYKFRIISETATEYVVLDADTTNYELSQVRFYINKMNLHQARCEDEQWEFIVTKEFFASFDLDEVKKEFYTRQIILTEMVIFQKGDELKKLEDIHNQKTKKSYNRFFSFNEFKLNDTIYFLYDKKLYETRVVSFVTLDKVNFIPNIGVDFGNIIEDYVPIKQRIENGELYVEVTDHSYDYINYLTPKVFLSKDDYNVYLELVEYTNEITKINILKNSINTYTRELEKMKQVVSNLNKN